MQPGRPSRTAEGAAALRAAHCLFDDPPHLLEDEAVIPLLSLPARLLLRRPPNALRRMWQLQELSRPEIAALRGQIVLRARFAEEVLCERMEQGVAQYVVLGAGLDSFSLRHPELLDRLAVFEVDHPDTQAWKRTRLPREVAARLHFAPVDFERETVEDGLLRAGLDPRRPVCVNWLGSVYYLTTGAVEQTLTALARVAAPGSALVLDYWTRGDRWSGRALLAGIATGVWLQREPLKTLLSSQALADLADAAGWEVALDLGARAQHARWLEGRRDALRVPEFARLARLQPKGRDAQNASGTP